MNTPQSGFVLALHILALAITGVITMGIVVGILAYLVHWVDRWTRGDDITVWTGCKTCGKLESHPADVFHDAFLADPPAGIDDVRKADEEYQRRTQGPGPDRRKP